MPAVLLAALDLHPRLRRQHAATAASLECILTLVYALLFTFTFSTAADAFLTRNLRTQAQPEPSTKGTIFVPGPPPAIANVAVGLASGLMVVQIFLALRFAASVEAYQVGCSTGKWAMPRFTTCVARGEGPEPILPRQLATRVWASDLPPPISGLLPPPTVGCLL